MIFLLVLLIWKSWDRNCSQTKIFFEKYFITKTAAEWISAKLKTSRISLILFCSVSCSEQVPRTSTIPYFRASIRPELYSSSFSPCNSTWEQCASRRSSLSKRERRPGGRALSYQSTGNRWLNRTFSKHFSFIIAQKK